MPKLITKCFIDPVDFEREMKRPLSPDEEGWYNDFLEEFTRPPKNLEDGTTILTNEKEEEYIYSYPMIYPRDNHQVMKMLISTSPSLGTGISVTLNGTSVHIEEYDFKNCQAIIEEGTIKPKVLEQDPLLSQQEYTKWILKLCKCEKRDTMLDITRRLSIRRGGSGLALATVDIGAELPQSPDYIEIQGRGFYRACQALNKRNRFFDDALEKHGEIKKS